MCYHLTPTASYKRKPESTLSLYGQLAANILIFRHAISLLNPLWAPREQVERGHCAEPGGLKLRRLNTPTANRGVGPGQLPLYLDKRTRIARKLRKNFVRLGSNLHFNKSALGSAPAAISDANKMVPVSMRLQTIESKSIHKLKNKRASRERRNERAFD